MAVMEQIPGILDSSHLSAFDLDSVLGQVVAFIRDCFQLPRVAVLLLDPANSELCVRKSSGWPADAAAVRIPVGKGIIGQAAALRQTVAVPDVFRHDGYIPVMTDTRSEVAIPFVAGDKLLGVLDCQSDHEIIFAPESVELLTVCSAHVSLALRHARMHEREQRLAA